jgi:hypothetical protein
MEESKDLLFFILVIIPRKLRLTPLTLISVLMQQLRAKQVVIFVLVTWHIRVRRFGAREIALEGQKVESNIAF